MLAIKELRERLEKIEAAHDATIQALDTRATTLERTTEELRRLAAVTTEQVAVLDSNVGALITTTAATHTDLVATTAATRTDLDQLSKTVSDAKISISHRVTDEFTDWRKEFDTRTLALTGLLAVSFIVGEVLARVF